MPEKKEKKEKKSVYGELTLEEHRTWAEKLWARMDRDNSGELEVDELNCDTFMQVLRGILSPKTASKSVAGYGRAEINTDQALKHFLKQADKSGDGVLDFEEFERFLRSLRKRRTPMEMTNIIFKLFDVDSDGHIGETEFRDIWRYFNGKNPTADEFTHHWSKMDTERAGRVLKPPFAKWLATSPAAFRSHAPPLVGDEDSVPSSARSSQKPGAKLSKEVFRPAPGLWHKPQKTWEHYHEWNFAFARKDPSEQNLAWRGSQRFKTMFSRPESMPELRRFYATYQGFQSHKRRLRAPEPPLPKPVLSHESIESLQQPGKTRHDQFVSNSRGEMVEWKQNTPRALQKRVWEPGSLLLRVPLPPAPFLVQGRDAPEPVK